MITENMKTKNFYIIKKVERPKDTKVKNAFWLCKCEKCGNEIIYNTQQIKQKIKSGNDCGCSKSLVDKVFGKLTVIEEIPDIRKNNQRVWRCKCECGNICEIVTSSLTSGNTKSCGCLKSIGLVKYNLEQSEKAKINIGSKFGKLTVLEDIGFKEHVKNHNRRWYKCQCDCGKIKEVMGNSLKTGYVSSCGDCISSKGENIIYNILQKNNINFVHDKVYPLLFEKTKRRLRFDFAIYENNNLVRVIEFDGRQHIEGMIGGNWSHNSSLQEIQERDFIKNNFCWENNIPIVRIPYSKIDSITLEDLLGDKFLCKKEEEKV